MSHEDLLQLFIVLLWLGNTVYLSAALYASRPATFRTRLETKPLARAAQMALRKIVGLCIFCTTVITFSYLVISEYTLGEVIAAPDAITSLAVLRYVCFYAMATLPGTFLWGHLRSLKVIDQAKYHRMIEVQEAAHLGIPPEEYRKQQKGEG